MDTFNIKGLEEKEAKVYLDLLSLKKAKLLELSKISEIKRTTLYRLLDKLIEKGLVSEIYEGKRHYYIAESPEKLLNFLAEQKEKIKKILPQLKALEEEVIERPKIKFYEGKEGIRSLYEEILKDKNEIIGFSWPEKLFKKMEFFPDLVKKRIKLKIPMRLIMPDTKLARQRKKAGKKELRTVKLVPSLLPFESVFYISGKKVVMFSLKSWFVGVLIENREIAAGLKSLYEALWQKLK